MAIEFNDNIHVKINRPTDFRFGPFTDINQANAIIPIAQRYHGLIFGVYTTPLSIATSDVKFYYYWDGLTNTDIKELGGKPPVDGSYANQAAMIAAQATQTPKYLYYDGTSYWEYLGTTNGNITDYRILSVVSQWINTTGGIYYNDGVAIGTSTISGFKLDVNGTTRLQGNTTITGDLTVDTNTLYVDSANNRVGIGTTSPQKGIDSRVVAGITVSSGNFTPVLQVENTGSASIDFKNVALFVGARGNPSDINDNTNIGIWQKNATNNNFGVFNFYNAGGNLSASFGTRFVNHGGAQIGDLIFATSNFDGFATRMTIYGNGNIVTGSSANAGFKLDVTGTLRVQGNTTLTNGINLILGTTTGTKIGTSTTQKIGFFNATPIVQPSGDVLTALQNLGLVASPTAPYPEAIHRENNTVIFDNDYVTGINSSARTGNILFDFTGAKLAACTVMKHQDASPFTFPTEAVLMFDTADISTTVANYFMFSIMKTTATQIVHVFHAIEGGV